MNTLIDNMLRYIGQTVTVFTTSGGISGSGFTGVLLSADCNNIRLLCKMGAAPGCPIGSSCSCSRSNNWFGYNNNWLNYNRGSCMSNPLGSITIIPVRSIACFTHNAI